MSTDTIVKIKLSKLDPDPDNVNQHSALNISQIVASIQKFGFADPLGVVRQPDSGLERCRPLAGRGSLARCHQDRVPGHLGTGRDRIP